MTRSIIKVVAIWFISLACIAQQSFPSKPLTMLVPLPPGSDTDVVARVLAQGLSIELKQPVVIDNKPGAGGQIAMQAAAASKPDGYTLAMTFQAAATIVPQLKKQPPYDPTRDFTNIARVATTANVLVVRQESSIKNVQDLLRQAKDKPGKLSYGSWGIGSGGHLAGEVINVDAGIQTQHIPYKGTLDEVRALVSGEIDYGFVGIGIALTHSKSGSIRVIGVLSPERIDLFPQAQTLKENGIRFAQEGWFGVVAPAGLPVEIKSKLEEAILKASRSAEFVQKTTALGMNPVTAGASEFNQIIKQEFHMWGDWLNRLNWAKE